MAIVRPNAGNKILVPNRNLVNGLKFSSSSSHYITAPMTVGYFRPASSWTMIVVCKLPTSNSGSLIGSRNSSGGTYSAKLTCTTGGFITYIWGNSFWGEQVMQGTARPARDGILHIAIQNQLNQIRLSVNGVQLSNRTDGLMNINDVTQTGVIEIGRTIADTFAAVGSYFNGYILDVKFFNAYLSNSDVTKLYKYGGGKMYDVPTTSLKGWWKLDEKNGKTASDSSGNGNNGTLTNYSNAETASSGQPQSGNTAWVEAYTRNPIII